MSRLGRVVLSALRFSCGELELRFVWSDALDHDGEVIAGEVPVEGFGDLVPVLLEGVECARDSGRSWKSLGSRTLRCAIEK